MSNIPKLRFPEFIGEWEEKKLNSIFTKITQRNSDNQNSNVITNSATEGLVSQRDYFDKDIANKDKTDNYFIIKNGDFVYNPRKSSAAPYGPFTQYKLLDDGIVSPLYLCLRKNNSEVESKYLENYFKTTCWHQYIYENGSSGARHDRVSIHDDVLLAMPIKVPSLPEQQKIAYFLSNVNSIITAETKILNALQKKKKALMQKLFTRQLRFKSADGTDFPAWEEKKLEECVKKVCVGFVGVCEQFYTDKSGIPMYRTGNLKNGKVNKLDLKYVTKEFHEKNIKSQLQKYDILIARHGENGQASLYNYDEQANCLNIVIVRPNEELAFHNYLINCINSDFVRKEVSRKTAGSTQSVINTKAIEGLIIPIPCKAEQQKIADCLSSIDSLIQTQQKVVTTWQHRKKALLQQMFI